MALQEETQLELLKTRIPDGSEVDLVNALSSAKSVILNTRYPYEDYPITELEDGTKVVNIEDRYLDLQLRMAVELYNRNGIEGENAHTENSVQRIYDNSTISKSLVNEIVPKGKVI